MEENRVVKKSKEAKAKKKKEKEEEGEEKKQVEDVPEAYTKAATERLLKELKELRQPNVTKDGYSVAPVEDNIYKWHVKLFGWDDDAQIKQDLTLYESLTQRDHVLLEEYPNMPPFIRVVYPRFHQYTGHITIGGSICVKDLTRSGWSAEFQLQPFFVMIRNLLLEGGALVDMDNYATDYSEQEAREAFDRVARAHGWEP
ncbi:Ubiquitinconjugating enzyme subfamily protein [Acanthamoeba castellanii str. Neff]|uniref:Ubiquitinconjugating enzyme subfamily protein n=1 Tax=Acanthamoeba castellanii (strain ATCC 30010 / Neff) TaxID=1257118 RepID=L8GYQ1_ACACF|nr:Ubiquitinconjugating enzyme subfamily protein [Acanthamoeba castellanii str. Neff]ELR18414.1 Ubiquitinconjugating enzyme subfamily protein [Acanthamoeba castellanii str. Neff]